MGREREFRGKRKDNGEWVYGFYGYKYDGDRHFIMQETISDQFPSHFTDYEVFPESVGQNTGLHDKNGQDIYRGDLVRYLDGSDCSSECGADFDEYMNIGVIEWYPEEARYSVSNRNMVDLETFFEEIGDSDVVGNIFENPELLEV